MLIRSIIAHYLIPVLANFVTALAGGFMGSLIVFPAFEQSMEELRNWIGVTFASSFGPAIFLFLIYNRHIFSDLYHSRPFSSPSRIENLTKTLQHEILVSLSTKDAIQSDEEMKMLQPAGSFSVKGRRLPVELFTLEKSDEKP